MEFKAIKKVTATEQIMDKIASMVVSGDLKPGDKLPNERLLAEQFNVARGRIREALRALSLIGLVTIRAGDGTYINQRDHPLSEETITWIFYNELHNLDELYDARCLIETAVYLSALQHLKQEDFDHLDHLIGTMSNYRNTKYIDSIVFLQLLDQFDAYVGERCGNRIYTKLLQTMLHLRRDSSLKLLRVPQAIDRSVENRNAILAALKTGKISKVENAVDRLFKTAKTLYHSTGLG